MRLFPAIFLARTVSELLAKGVQEVAPPAFVSPCQVMIRKVGVHEGHDRLLTLLREGHGNHRLFAQGARRHPGMLQATRSLELGESAVMGRSLEGPVKESVSFRIHDELL